MTASMRLKGGEPLYSKKISIVHFKKVTNVKVEYREDRNAPLRTGSRASLRTLTKRDIPNGAVKIHSWVLSGRALDICDIN